MLREIEPRIAGDGARGAGIGAVSLSADACAAGRMGRIPRQRRGHFRGAGARPRGCGLPRRSGRHLLLLGHHQPAQGHRSFAARFRHPVVALAAGVFMRGPVRSWTSNGFFWSGNVSMVVGSALSTGGAVVLQRWFDADEALRLIEDEKIAFINGRPHQWARLREAKGWAERRPFQHQICSARRTDLAAPERQYRLGSADVFRHDRDNDDLHFV